MKLMAPLEGVTCCVPTELLGRLILSVGQPNIDAREEATKLLAAAGYGPDGKPLPLTVGDGEAYVDGVGCLRYKITGAEINLAHAVRVGLTDAQLERLRRALVRERTCETCNLRGTGCVPLNGIACSDWRPRNDTH